MKVLQLIDSLNPGGAETVAVSYANALLDTNADSFLCTTRAEGLLKQKLDTRVTYLFLERTKTLDFKAIKRLVRFCKSNAVSHIHAHSSSYFIARMAMFYLPNCKLIWHDHYGKSEMLKLRPVKMLKWCSKKFSTIITVNELLQTWANTTLLCQRVVFLKNAIPKPESNRTFPILAGVKGKRIVHLANFREQKDHLNLLSGFAASYAQDKELHLHLVGMYWEDAYYKSVISRIEALNLGAAITLHGPIQDVYGILLQCDIGVLSSNSEGLPMALLEYGMAGLAVITTDVGQCSQVIGPNGVVIPANEPKAITKAITYYLNNAEVRKKMVNAYQNHIEQEYSIQSIIPKLLNIYEAGSKTN